MPDTGIKIDNLTGAYQVSGTAMIPNTTVTVVSTGPHPSSNVVITVSGTVGSSDVTSGTVSCLASTSAVVSSSGTAGDVNFAGSVNFVGDEPAVGATTASVYRIGALVDAGHGVNEIRQDFPTLSADQIKSAAQYVQQHPNPGVHYPTAILDKVLRKSGLHKVIK